MIPLPLAFILAPQIVRVPALFSVIEEQIQYMLGRGVECNLKTASQADLQYWYDIAKDDETRATIKQFIK